MLWGWICFITFEVWVLLDTCNFTILADTPVVHISERGEMMTRNRNVTVISCVEIREYCGYVEQLVQNYTDICMCIESNDGKIKNGTKNNN